MVDTSIWICALKKSPNRAIKDRVDELLGAKNIAVSAPIKLEILSGLKNTDDFNRMTLRLNALTNFQIKDSTWVTATNLAFNLRRKGLTIPYMDLIIGACSIENETVLVHADSHYDALAQHSKLQVESHIQALKS